MSVIQAYLRDIYDCYVTAMKGLHVTIKVMADKPFTKQYPEEDTGVTAQFRGLHVFHHDKCNGCGLCAKRCPVECIAIEKVGKGKTAIVTRYAIDYTKCLFCSLCCEACPHDAITMGHDWYLEAASRDECMREFVAESELPEWALSGEVKESEKKDGEKAGAGSAAATATTGAGASADPKTSAGGPG